MSVGDDGVGVPAGSAPAKAGLGTSIIEALAKQLNAKVTLASNAPGTTVPVVHITAISSAGIVALARPV